ncbi:hypothetical protein WJX72_010408 [[Myrmecia] bisecta]|uniref:Uncharacterized protein n=1 Tax=[Myrmecia] bisecta TaxID=41462 RepID=A0AAW1PAS8_9CHLO
MAQLLSTCSNLRAAVLPHTRAVSKGRVVGLASLPARAPLRIVGQAQNRNSEAVQLVRKAAGVGAAAAAFLAAGNAQAAQEVATLAASDNRLGIIATLFLPVVGWVALNMFGPAKNQLDNMNRGLAAGLGLSAAALLAAQSSDAAEEVAQLAANDNRFAIIATLFLPVVGWVVLNMFGPAKNQLDNMGRKK